MDDTIVLTDCLADLDNYTVQCPPSWKQVQSMLSPFRSDIFVAFDAEAVDHLSQVGSISDKLSEIALAAVPMAAALAAPSDAEAFKMIRTKHLVIKNWAHIKAETCPARHFSNSKRGKKKFEHRASPYTSTFCRSEVVDSAHEAGKRAKAFIASVQDKNPTHGQTHVFVWAKDFEMKVFQDEVVDLLLHEKFQFVTWKNLNITTRTSPPWSSSPTPPRSTTKKYLIDLQKVPFLACHWPHKPTGPSLDDVKGLVEAESTDLRVHNASNDTMFMLCVIFRLARMSEQEYETTFRAERNVSLSEIVAAADPAVLAHNEKLRKEYRKGERSPGPRQGGKSAAASGGGGGGDGGKRTSCILEIENLSLSPSEHQYNTPRTMFSRAADLAITRQKGRGGASTTIRDGALLLKVAQW
ncbi:hypothetical protein B0H63DRAFT_550969 [Podospora didyma]|uniref:Uncharacterized protein n=1 Tax=Podospora didyma TaxID=330526 RepID=A0AAE0KA86_9PEZI|nr:hypothetical protein B0H63DRAFT_550969 [Podospora didyma]